MAEQIQNALTILRRRQVEKRVNPRRRLDSSCFLAIRDALELYAVAS